MSVSMHYSLVSINSTYHYEREIDQKEWITIVNSTGDLPTLRYASCFMASCNTARHFSETLKHGVLLFTMDETYGEIGGEDKKLDNDYLTGGCSWGITHYVRLLTEGNSWTEIVTFLNQNHIFEGLDESPKVPLNYKFHAF